MNDQRNFALKPLSATLKWMTLLPLLLTSTHAFARTVVDGQPRDIDGSVAADQYLLRNQASLTATGASTNDIRAESNSSLTLNGSTVTSAVSTIAVELVNSQATINRSTVTGARVGLSLSSLASAPVGSTATVTDSVITGGTTGIEVGSLGNLTLTRAVVWGDITLPAGSHVYRDMPAGGVERADGQPDLRTVQDIRFPVPVELGGLWVNALSLTGQLTLELSRPQQFAAHKGRPAEDCAAGYMVLFNARQERDPFVIPEKAQTLALADWVLDTCYQTHPISVRCWKD